MTTRDMRIIVTATVDTQSKTSATDLNHTDDAHQQQTKQYNTDRLHLHRVGLRDVYWWLTVLHVAVQTQCVNNDQLKYRVLQHRKCVISLDSSSCQALAVSVISSAVKT